MDQLTAINEAIENLQQTAEELEAEQESQNAYQSGDMVNYDHEGDQGVALVESIDEQTMNIRVMAVAGDNYEPTDDVLTVSHDSVSPLNGEPAKNEDEPESEEEQEADSESNDDDKDEDEENLEKGLFVSWQSKNGEVCGRVVSLSNHETLIIPETGDEYRASKTNPIALIEVFQKTKQGYEDTGVHVALPITSIQVIESPELKQRKLMVKVKKYDLDEEEEQKFGYFSGISSAYGKVDLSGDTVEKGAYTQTINHHEGKLQLMFDHGWKVSDVAGVVYLGDVEEGLEVKAKMPLQIKGVADGFEMIKFMQAEGKPLGLSIGYIPVKVEPGPNGTRRLKEISLEEITITPYPMDTHARIRDAKERKFYYNTKRKGWQTLQKTVNKTDAPPGNQDREGDFKSLGDILTNIINEMETK